MIFEAKITGSKWPFHFSALQFFNFSTYMLSLSRWKNDSSIAAPESRFKVEQHELKIDTKFVTLQGFVITPLRDP